MKKDIVEYLGHRCGVSKQKNEYCMMFVAFEEMGVNGLSADTIFLVPGCDMTTLKPHDKIELLADKRGNVFGFKVVGKADNVPARA